MRPSEATRLLAELIAEITEVARDHRASEALKHELHDWLDEHAPSAHIERTALCLALAERIGLSCVEEHTGEPEDAAAKVRELCPLIQARAARFTRDYRALILAGADTSSSGKRWRGQRP